jgi:hypothetical protein
MPRPIAHQNGSLVFKARSAKRPEMMPIEGPYNGINPSLIPMITAVIRLLAPSFRMELLK